MIGLVGPFEYCVFWSNEETPEDWDHGAAAYVTSPADARYLEERFRPLSDSHGFELSMGTDDATANPVVLRALNETLDAAIQDVTARPDTWPVILGYRPVPFGQPLVDPITAEASKERLLSSLPQMKRVVLKALRDGGYVHVISGT